MVSSDTVVGIVGSALLVAVMAGVFIYEYQSPDVPVDPRDPGPAFNSMYKYLNRTQDIDSDGVPNHSDPDIDGDNLANANDTIVAVVVPFAGSTPPVPSAPVPLPGGPSGVIYTLQFFVGTGAAHVNGTATYEVTLPAPVPPAPGLSVSVIDGAGRATPATQSFSGTTVSYTIQVPNLTVGNYTVQVSQTSPGPPVAFAGSILIHYQATDGDTEHTH